MDKFIGFFRTVSYLLFLAALLWSYANMVGQVNYSFDSLGNSEYQMDKNLYFFGGIGVFIFANAVCAFFIQTLKKIKSSEEGRGLRNRALKLDLLTWTKGFAGILNLFFALIMFFLGLMNLAESRQSATLGFYVYLGPILIVLWFFYLAYLLGKKRN